MNLHRASQRGFSLVELAIVLVIVALLSGGLMLGLSAQRDAAAYQEAQHQLDTAKEALLGFAISNGRLPCPAASNSVSGGANAGMEDCLIVTNSNQRHGVLPWATLGLPETDAWDRRLTYFVSLKFSTPLAPGSLSSFAMNTGIYPDNAGTANVKLIATSTSNIATDLAAVVVSHGRRGLGGYTTSGAMLAGAAGDEAENADADLTFVAHTQSMDFDDLVTWITPALLKSRLVAVGKLP